MTTGATLALNLSMHINICGSFIPWSAYTHITLVFTKCKYSAVYLRFLLVVSVNSYLDFRALGFRTPP